MVRRALKFAFALALLASIVVAPVLARAFENTFEAEVERFKVGCGFQVVLQRPDLPLLDVERACQQRSLVILRHYGKTLTSDDEAFMAYRLTLLEQVDRGTISPIQANFLFSEYRRAREAEAAERDAAERAAQIEQRRAWDENRRAYRNLFPTSPPPVNCTTTWIGGTASTTCR